jgi:hypothetical protein
MNSLCALLTESAPNTAQEQTASSVRSRFRQQVSLGVIVMLDARLSSSYPDMGRLTRRCR